VRGELAELLAGGAAAQVLRQRRAVVLGGHRHQMLGHGGGGQVVRHRVGVRRRDRPQRGLQAVLGHAAQPDQVRMPLPAVVDAVPAAVREFVQQKQRQLQVLVGQQRGGVGSGRGEQVTESWVEVVRAAGECRGYGVGHRSA
jgi:hypothetical protein